MIDNKVTFEMVFPIEPYRNFKLGYEGSIEPNETYEEAAQKAFDKVMDQGNLFLAKLTGQYTVTSDNRAVTPSILAERQMPEEERIAEIIEALNKCTTLPRPDGLESFYTIALTNGQIKEAYEAKKAILVKKEIDGILEATEELHQKLNQ